MTMNHADKLIADSMDAAIDWLLMCGTFTTDPEKQEALIADIKKCIAIKDSIGAP